MKLTDRQFWNNCGNVINELFLWLFFVLAILLVIDLWGMMITAFIYIIGGDVKTFTLLKIYGALSVVLILFSNLALWQSMYSPKIYNRLISIVWDKRLRLWQFLTLGYMNTYLLNLYFIRYKYSLYELTQYRVNVIYSSLVMFPIINIPVYIAAIRRRNCTLQLGEIVRLYLQGKLAVYLIQTDYSSLIQDENETSNV